MNLTAVSVGTRGDVEPLIELGVEMMRRGHEFRVAAMEKFRQLCEARGVPFIHLDGDADYLMKLLVTDFKRGSDFVSGMEKFYQGVPGILDQISNAVKGRDAVLYGTCSLFTRSAADLHHVPCIRYYFSPYDRTNQYSLYTSRHNSPLVGLTYLGQESGMNIITKRLFNEWRMAHGLPAWKMTSDYRVQDGMNVPTFYPVSPILMPPDPKWGSHIHVTGYWYHPEEQMDYRPDDALTAFLADGEKPIFVAFGGATSPEMDELQLRCVRALEETGIRAIVQARVPGAARRVYEAKNLHLVGAVPYPWMFEQVRAAVHHGGNSTNGLGLRAGLPTLVIPLALDQYYYGRTVHELGCGPGPIYVRKRIAQVEELKSALLSLVSGEYDKASQEVGQRLKRENGCLAAAEAIEAWQREIQDR